MFRVAVIGTGFIAVQKHFPAWQKARGAAKVVALCDVDLERGKKVAQEAGVARAYDNLETLLETERPDIVDICTPPRTHASVACTALASGAHTLIEKPMAMSSEECDSILSAAETAGRKVCVAHSDLFYPAFRKARALVARGEIGEFKGMRIFLSTPVDYITSKPDHWAHRLPGGVIGETGPHIVYMTLAFINPVQEVRINAQKLLHQYPWSPFEDYRLDLIGENATCSATLVYTTTHWGAEVEIWGTDGLLKADLESQTVSRYHRNSLKPVEIAASSLREASQIVEGVLGTGLTVATGRFQNTHELLIRQFLESIENGGQPPVSAQEGREAVRVMNQIVEQLQEKVV
jgi:predicted dehydrogenase